MRRRRWCGLVILALAVLVAACTSASTPQAAGTRVTLPNVVGQGFEQADRTLQAERLRVQRISVTAGGIAPDSVVAMNPLAGTTTTQGTVVKLTVASFSVPPTTAAPNSPALLSWTVRVADQSGYSAVFQIQVGSIQPVPAGTTEVGTCQIDPSTDAAIPVHVTATNTTPAFPEGVTLQLENDNEFGGLSTLGPACESASSVDPQNVDALGVLSDGSNGQVPPNSVALDDSFTLYLRPYYSPAHPQGDTAHYQRTALIVLARLQLGSGNTTTTIDGPGISALPPTSNPVLQMTGDVRLPIAGSQALFGP